MGVFEEAKGKVKEVVGDITNNPELEREGEAQKNKGEAEHEATEARAEAKAHEAKAKAHEAEQKLAESAKNAGRFRQRKSPFFRSGARVLPPEPGGRVKMA